MKQLVTVFVTVFAIALGCIAAVFLLLASTLFLFMPQTEVATGNTGGQISELGQNEIPPQYIPIYQAAAQQYGVPWNLLAAIHRVETVFSTIDPMVSGVGAEGHVQFMPCTWVGWSYPSCGGLGAGNIPTPQKTSPMVIKQHGGFGVDGNGDGIADPWDVTDAIYSAANYLAANGAANGNYEKAVFTYNHSQKYVSDVIGFMKRFANDSAPELVPGTGGFLRPLNTPMTSPFEMRFHPILRIWRQHAGIDLDCETGDPIPASKAGIVSYSGWQNAYNPKEGLGIHVWIEHGGGYKTSYGHMSMTSVTVGQQVEAGQVIGACGNTGGSTGSHLHFEIFLNNKQVDPAPYLGL